MNLQSASGMKKGAENFFRFSLFMFSHDVE